MEFDPKSQRTILDDVQSTVSVVRTRDRLSYVVPATVDHNDIPKSVVDPSPSTVTKSGPLGDVVEQSVASETTAPTTVSDKSVLEKDSIGWAGKAPTNVQTIPESQDRSDSGQSTPNIPNEDRACTSDVSTETSRLSDSANDSPSSSKRVSIAISQVSSNRADSGSDVSSHGAISLRYPISKPNPRLLLKKTSNRHLSAKISSIEEFNTDMDRTFPPGPEHDADNSAVTTGASRRGQSALKRLDRNVAEMRSKGNKAKRTDEGQQRKCLARRKALVTGLALLAMATIIVRPKLPPR